MKRILFPFKNIFLILASLLVIGCQFQFTPNILGTAIRMSLSDIILPVVWINIIFLSWGKHFSFKVHGLLYPACILAVFSLWMTSSLLISYLYSGSLSSWALFNKFCGWFLVLGYFWFGVAVSLYLSKEYRNQIIKIFLMTSWLISSIEFLTVVFDKFNVVIPYFEPEFRLTGCFENPNAYGLFCVFCLLIHLPFVKAALLFRPIWHQFGLAINVVALIYSCSRSAYVALIIGVSILALKKQFPSKIINSFWILLILLGISNFPFKLEYAYEKAGKPQSYKFEEYLPGKGISSHALRYYTNENLWNGKDGGAQERLETTKQALNLWKTHPLMGIGLGGFLEQQKVPVGQRVALHNTPLWLMTEMGLVGLALMLSFMFVCFHDINKFIYHKKASDPLLKSVLAIMVGFAAASLVTELTYQRHLWFWLGLVLGSIQEISTLTRLLTSPANPLDKMKALIKKQLSK